MQPVKKTKAAADDRAQRQKEKRKQYNEAEEYCAREGVGARACISANPHLNPVKYQALYALLAVKVVTGAEYNLHPYSARERRTCPVLNRSECRPQRTEPDSDCRQRRR